MDAMVAKVEGGSIATRQSLEELKEEMRGRYEETRKHVNVLETKVKNMEKKLEEFSMQVFTTMQNICTSLLDSPWCAKHKLEILLAGTNRNTV